MRRLLVSWIGLALFLSVVGCEHHYQGICDCDMTTTVMYNYGSFRVPVAAEPSVKCETGKCELAKATPKAEAP